ncbi:MAG: YbgC/FadM family acyl-CoA thioesterase [Steroidobacteraceae bacterium]
MSTPFSHSMRVYWEDTDGGGIVYYANYLRFLERARTEWLRARGWSQQALAIDPGILFAVVHVDIRYRESARLDDLLVVSCVPRLDGRVVARFEQRICRDSLEGLLLAEATVEVACIDARNHRPKRLPAFLFQEAST